MKLKIDKNGIVYNEENKPIAVMCEEATELDYSIISVGSELIDVAKNFVSDVNSGKLKPRKAVSEFEKVLEKIPA